MNEMMKTVFALVCVAGTFAAPVARADIPPPDVCLTKGAVCHNAGADFSGDGLCTQATCMKGGPQPLTYECLKCTAGEAGAAGQLDGSGTAGEAGTSGQLDDAGAGGTIGVAGTHSVGKAGSTASIGGATHSAGSANSAGAADQPSKGDDGGCSIGVLGSERGIGSLMLGLGLVALGISRRRR